MASSTASNDTELLNLPTATPGSSPDYPIVISSDDEDDARSNGWRVMSPIPFPDLDAFASMESQSPKTVLQNFFDVPVEISDDSDDDEVGHIAPAPEIIIISSDDSDDDSAADGGSVCNE
jgi:hypothetical protein